MGERISETVEVYADIVCPFTHVGLRRLFALRDEMGRRDVAIRVRAWPLEIVNGELLGRELLEEEIEELRASVARDLFTGFDPGLFPMSSLPALALVERAYRHDLRTGEELSAELRDVLFEHRADLGSLEVLASIADRYGVGLPDETDHAAILADQLAGQRPRCRRITPLLRSRSRVLLSDPRDPTRRRPPERLVRWTRASPPSSEQPSRSRRQAADLPRLLKLFGR